MNTQIKLTYNDVDYVLEYNRATIKMLEKAGFLLDEFLTKPMNNIELAFSTAFIKNHPKVSQDTIDKIYSLCKDKKLLITTLGTMINECYDSLMDDPDVEDDDSKNVTWEVMDLSPKKTSQK